MYTSNYNNYINNDDRFISISGDKGKKVGYDGQYYMGLAPKLAFWKIWHDNIGNMSEEEKIRYYVEEYYKQVLSQLDPNEVYESLKGKILLCYEEPKEFCHRHIVAVWIKLLLGIEVPEMKLDNNQFVETQRYEGLEVILEEIIKENLQLLNKSQIRSLNK